MIVVAGEALVDVITRRDGSIDAVPGGGPFNTARAIGRLGVPVAWAGVLSVDEHGARWPESLAADGVSLDLVQRTDAADDAGVRGARRSRRGALPVRRGRDTSAPSLDAGTLLAALPSDVAAVHVGTLGLVFEPIAGHDRDAGRDRSATTRS